MDDLFTVPGAPWRPVSQRLVTLRRALVAVAAIGSLVVIAMVAWVWSGARLWLLACVGLVLVSSAVGWLLVARGARSWAYAERDDDLLLRHGVMWLRLEVVPYGRMQLVDVSAGPLQRRAAIATVTLRTAAPDTRARIPGLDPAEAARLRDRLSERGEAQAAGL